MPRRKSIHAQLDEKREQVAAATIKKRELEAQIEAAKAKVEEASRLLAAAYALEDERLAKERREKLERAEAEVIDLEHRRSGAELRAQRARQELDEFMADNARALLDERERTAREVADRLTRAVAEAVKARHAYDNERQQIDQLVAQVPGASVRADGVSTGYAWETPLRDLERAYREGPEADVLRPRWSGMTYRQNMDAVHQRLQSQRRKPNNVAETVRPPA
jgi:HD-GYP domain-containing protein (c-di-GMP phosphodiesterase class II)